MARFLEGRRVLVVDPSENFRSSMRVFFGTLEVKNVRTVATIREARQILPTDDFALIIVEWLGAENDDNGLQFCREIRRDLRTREIPLLLVAAENLRADVVLAAEVGIDSYLLKPFSYEEFIGKVISVVTSATDPNPIQRLLRLGEAEIFAKNLVEAELLFNSALELDQTSARAFCGLGTIALRRGEFRKAQELLELSVSENYEFLHARRLLVELYQSLGDVDKQYGEAKVLAKLSPDNPRYHLALAKLCLQREEIDESEKHFKRVVALSPKLAEGYRGLGDIAIIKEDYLRAEKFFRKALDLDHDDISSLNALGMANVRLGRYKEGIAKYMIALRFQPRDPRIHFNVGHAEEKQGNYGEATKWYLKALELQTPYDKAERGLERIKSLQENSTSASSPHLEGDSRSRSKLRISS